MDKKHIVFCDQKPANCHEMVEAYEPGYMLELCNEYYICRIADIHCPYSLVYKLLYVKKEQI